MERVQSITTSPLKFIALAAGVALLLISLFIFDYVGIPTQLSQIKALAVDEILLEVKAPLQESEVRTWLPPLKGKNILFVSSSSIVEKLKANAWVGEVAVRKAFPDRLEIQVQPKKPTAIRLRGGLPYYLDESGKEIARVIPGMIFSESFTVVNFVNEKLYGWENLNVIQLISEVKKQLPATTRLSEISFSTFPIFRVFLVSPQWEVVLNFENWETQMPFLTTFLKGAPLGLTQTRRINLTLGKKAIVSSPISQ